MIDENDLWLLSFYRISEINGALFFGRLARTIKPGPVQLDMTKHFSDEAMHAWYWTDCIDKLGAQPLKLEQTYQDQYPSAVGMPANLMEVLAITQVFERRTINEYARYSQVDDLPVPVLETLARIMNDEKWHIEWVKKALKIMEPEYGKETIEETIHRFWKADQEVFRKTLQEHEDRLRHIFARRK